MSAFTMIINELNHFNYYKIGLVIYTLKNQLLCYLSLILFIFPYIFF